LVLMTDFERGGSRMTDMIEKMARAMATITHISPDTKQAAFMGSGSIPLGYGPEYWRTFVPFCHAALEALRDQARGK
jgi:hypothetical protein